MQQHGADARLLMGGTDLLVRMRDGVVLPRVVVDVKGVPGLREVQYDSSSGLTIGAAVTMNEVARNRHVRAHYPLLAEAARTVASYTVRNRATIGGNLCNASPAADTAPAVLVLEARMVLYGPRGEREVPAAEFFLGPGKTVREPEEFLTAVRLPKLVDSGRGRYLKLGRNKAGDLAIAGVAVWAAPQTHVASGYLFRIALASVAPVPLRAYAAEDVLLQFPPGEAAYRLAADKAAEGARPVDDVRASAAYRRAMVRNLTWRALSELGIRDAE